jgi:RHS repeat-associated protein
MATLILAGPVVAQDCDCIPMGMTYDASEDCTGHVCAAPAFPCNNGWTQRTSGPLAGLCVPPCPGQSGAPTDCQSFADAIKGKYYPNPCDDNLKCLDNAFFNSPDAMRSTFFEWVSGCFLGTDCDRNSDGRIDCADLSDLVGDALAHLSLDEGCRRQFVGKLVCDFVTACAASGSLEGGACVDAMDCGAALIGDDPEQVAILAACLGAICEAPRQEEDNPKPRPGPIPAPWQPGVPCGGSLLPGMDGFRNISPPLTIAPVDVAYGDKADSAIDLVVQLAGPPFSIAREYTSDPAYSSSAPVGYNWTASVLRFVDFEVTGSGPTLCCSATAGGMAGGSVSNTGCVCESGGFGNTLQVPGPTAQRFDKTTLVVGGKTYATWRLVEPGEWEVDFYREASGTEPVDAGLVGKILQARDVYGNRHEYQYTLLPVSNPGGGNDGRLTQVTCRTSDGELQARILFFWHLGPGSDLAGKLAAVTVLRPHPTLDVDVPTQRVPYVYLEDDSTPHLGLTGDLVEVRTDERVDPVPGATDLSPVWRTRVTQYRYHTGANNETSDSTGSGGDGYVEKGNAHQLKLVILPEQVEFYAQKKAEAVSGTHDVVEFADDLRAVADGASESGIGLKPVDLAAKVVEQYETGSGTEGRVLTEYLLTGGGCSGGATQGLKCAFEYLTYSGGRTTKVTESRKDGTSWIAHRVRYADMELIGSAPSSGPDGRGWYLVNDVVADPTRSGLWWVTHYERSDDADQTLDRIVTPAAMSSYQPADRQSPAVAPTYSASATDGLVYAFGYSDAAYRSEVRVRKDKPSTDTLANYWLVSQTTFRTTSGERHLPATLKRVRTEEQTSLPSDANIEQITFDYDFFAGTSKALSWVKTTVEGESTSENGPGTDYSSWEIFDTRGLNVWSVAADGSSTRRVFDNDEDFSGGLSVSRTGSVVKTIHNASRSSDGFPTSNVPTGLPSDRNGDGGSLTTTVRRDILGRVQEAATPGGVTHVTTREMRTSPERPNLRYYAEVSLPYSLGSGVFDGPAVVDWRTASGATFESRGHKLTAAYTAADPDEPYRQIYSNYALDASSTGLLSRSSVEQHPSGLVQSERRWHDPNATSGGFYETSYTYDALGRVDEVTGPTGTSKWTVVSRSFYDSTLVGSTETDGVGNGNLTVTRLPVDGTAGNERVYRHTYDYRSRRIAATEPTSPHEILGYDNLDRVTQKALVAGSAPPSPTDFDASDTTRRSYARTVYGQRGAAVRQEVAIDPELSSANRTYLATNTWFDATGRAVATWSPTAPATKTTYDGLGRTTTTYVTDRGGDTAHSDVHASNASVLTGDTVFEEVSQRYITATGLRKGLPDLLTVRRRAHGDTATGAITSSSTAVVSYAMTFYDAAERVSRTADYGTAKPVFEAGGTAPTDTQASPPNSSDTVLVTITGYDERGLVATVTDPDGHVTKHLYDGLSRTYATIENDGDADVVVSWSTTLSHWIADNVGTTDGTDRVTSMVYDGNDNVVQLVAHQAKVSQDGDRDQVTQYVYGVSIGAVSGTQVQSDLWSNDLLLKTIYPDERVSGGATEAERTVWRGHNRQGDVISVEDQNDTLHVYALDPAGRVTSDTVTLASGSPIDGTITKVETAYDDAGRPSTVRSRSSASGNPIVNEVEFGYTKLWQIDRLWQHAKGEVDYDGSGDPTGDTRLVRQTWVSTAVTASGSSVNHSRMTELKYPRNVNTGSPVTATLAYDYGSSSSPGNVISRVAGLSLDSTAIVNYEHVGAGLVTLVDYAVPDVQLDRTLSADGKRRFDTYTTQAAGVYPGLDRFGRIVRQVWADGALTTHGSLGTVPNRPPIVETGYTYDRVGSRTAALDLRPGNQWKMSWEYDYDGLHRLTAADRGKWNGSALTNLAGGQQWTLELLGNWSQWKFDADFSGSFSAAETEDRTHNGVNELLDRDQGTGGTDETLTYDLAGNLRTRVADSVTTTYTHDAWNRLVKVVAGSATLLEQQHNGLSWRTWKRADTNADGSLDEERTFAYDPSWRLLEERIDTNYVSSPGLDKRVQHVWGKRYIDDAVLHRRDRNNDGDYVDPTEGTWYHLTDAMYSTVALFAGAQVIERVTYTPYGEARHHFGNDVNGDGGTDAADQGIVLAAWGTTIGGSGYLAEADLNRDGVIDGADLGIVINYFTALSPGLISSASSSGPDNPIGWDGYVFNPESRSYAVRNRTYVPVLGRWVERDPAGYVDGQNLYEYGMSQPPVAQDAMGLQCGGSCVGPHLLADARGSSSNNDPTNPRWREGEQKGKRCIACGATTWTDCMLCCTERVMHPDDPFGWGCRAACEQGAAPDPAPPPFVPECWAVQPLPPGPVCNSYRPCDSYLGANARCFCQCMGSDPWSDFFRACLACHYRRGETPEDAHEDCYAEADRRFYGQRPLAKIAKCAVKCWKHQLVKCAF